MILLKKLQLNNFLSHENTTIDFGENEKALIDGASGAGKSSIFEGIIWALYGQGRSDNRSMVHKGAKKCSVILTLSGYVEGEITITRTASAGGKHSVDVSITRPDGTAEAYPLSGVREIQEWIDKELIGASYLLFVNSVAYVQGNTDNFVSQTAPKRKELLLEIVKAEDYRIYYEKARQTLQTIDLDANRIRGQISEIEAVLTTVRARLTLKDNYTKEIEEKQKKIDEIRPKIDVLKSRQAELVAIESSSKLLEDTLKTALKEHETLKISYSQKLQKISKKELITSEIDKKPSLVLELETVEKLIVTEKERLTEALQNDIKRREVANRKPVVHDRGPEIDRFNTQIKTIQEQPICPSGESCPYSGDHNKQITLLMLQKNACVAETIRESRELGEWDREMGSLPESVDPNTFHVMIRQLEDSTNKIRLELNSVDFAQRELALVLQEEKELPGLDKALADKREQVDELTRRLKDANPSSIKAEMERIRFDLLAAEHIVVDSEEHIARASVHLENIEKDILFIGQQTERINLYQKDISELRNKAKKLALLKDAFGSKGIETLVIDYLLPRLEEKINDILAKLSDFRVRLDTQRKSSDGENTVEGLFITICNPAGEEMDFSNYSGGEKVRINFAITEAFASLIKARIGWRTVDEAILALDENSLESFMVVAEDLLSKFPQVLLISHIQEIKDLLDKRIVISKTNNNSYVK